METLDRIKSNIEERKIEIVVIGLGYVGLPLACEFANKGFTVTGIEIDEEKVSMVNAGETYIEDVESDYIASLVKKGKLSATSDFSVIKKGDALIVCVPTPLSKTKDPDISYILKALEEIKKHLKIGHIVSLESTTYPGSTEELLCPVLEETGLREGVDFFLAYSPERINPGDREYTFCNIPKVVGGVSKTSTEVISLLYRQVLDEVIPVSSARVAEMTKLLENTFRSVNIALVNEVAIMCSILDINVWEVLDAASTKPFGFMKFYPGPGIGGHCIPVDPLYLSWKLKTLNYNARFIELASEINTNMPRYVVELLTDALNQKGKSVKGSKILILGVAYKRDVSDTRESPAIDIMKLLDKKGAEVSYNDPYVKDLKLPDRTMESITLTEDNLSKVDCVLIVTDHSVYDFDMIVENSNLVIDTKNATSGVKNELKEAKVVLL